MPWNATDIVRDALVRTLNSDREVAVVEFPRFGPCIVVECEFESAWRDWIAVRNATRSTGWWPVLVESDSVYLQINGPNPDGFKWMLQQHYDQKIAEGAKAEDLQGLYDTADMGNRVAIGWERRAQDLVNGVVPVDDSGREDWRASQAEVQRIDIEAAVRSAVVRPGRRTSHERWVFETLEDVESALGVVPSASDLGLDPFAAESMEQLSAAVWRWSRDANLSPNSESLHGYRVKMAARLRPMPCAIVLVEESEGWRALSHFETGMGFIDGRTFGISMVKRLEDRYGLEFAGVGPLISQFFLRQRPVSLDDAWMLSLEVHLAFPSLDWSYGVPLWIHPHLFTQGSRMVL